MICVQKGITFVLFLVALVMFASLAAAETGNIVLAKNSINRLFDHVIVKGDTLKGHLNKPIPLMRLYAFKEGKMEPIPFQIDEITEEGDWVLPEKSPYLDKENSKKSVLLKEDPHEVMDENDELAFMISDIGDRAAPSAWPVGWIYADELILTDPLTQDKGWVYLFSFAEPPERSPVDYVTYDLPPDRKDRLYTDNYTLGFSHIVPITQDYLDYRDGINILDRMKMRTYFRFFCFVKFDRNENDMQSMVWQYKDGPVRAVRMVRSSVRLIRNLQSPKINSETRYYRNATLLPIRIKIPRMAAGVVNEAFIDAGGDYRDLYGWKVRFNTDERWLNVDGKMDDVEKNINKDGARWYIIKNENKAMIIFIKFLEEYGMHTQFHYLDDDVNTFPPEFHPGQVPFIGFRIHDLHKIGTRENFGMNVICFYLNQNYSEEQLLQAMNIFDNPIQVSAVPFNNVSSSCLSRVQTDNTP